MKQLKLTMMAILAVCKRLFALPALSVVCIIALMLSAPAAAGWKENALNELSAVMRDLNKAGEAQGFPNLSINSANSVFSAMSGMCVGHAGESGTSIPKPTIDEILRVHKMILHGKIPKTKTLHNIGKLCLDYIENTARKKGASDAEIELMGEVMVKVLIPRLRAAFGLPPKQ